MGVSPVISCEGREMLQRTCCQRRIQGSRFGISRLSKGPWTWGTGGSSLKGDQSNYWLRDRPVASAYCPSIKGAGTRVCGYAIKNSGLTVEVIRQHLHVCVKELRVKILSPQGIGVFYCIVTSGREVTARGERAA